MAGATLSAAVVGCAAALVVGLATVGTAAVVGQRLAAAADAAALAAADTASGAAHGIPCERADEVAHAHDAVLAECRLEGLIATVSVTTSFGGVEATARARAGPPP
ncbi:Rv3654c family TadE-like protein [Microbacterium sp. 2FI]|uniref:Rv3654c family TadE-like protein n=1 Tax=Microbacterium sp. 2FI TaxID=2502193 RepID=UPI0010F4C5CB|nr:Rv3654c family TadE-like protein [Microbacterium sp. 2FI]